MTCRFFVYKIDDKQQTSYDLLKDIEFHCKKITKYTLNTFKKNNTAGYVERTIRNGRHHIPDKNHSSRGLMELQKIAEIFLFGRVAHSVNDKRHAAAKTDYTYLYTQHIMCIS